MTARRPDQTDFSFLRALHTDGGAMMTLSADRSIPSEASSREIFAQHLRHWEAHGFGTWLFSRTSDREEVGYCGLRRYELEGAEETELFFWVHSQLFRMGYGTEMARAVALIGFQEMKLHSIIGFTLSDNAGSRALMAKIGMTYEGPVEHAGEPHLMYRLKPSHFPDLPFLGPGC